MRSFSQAATSTLHGACGAAVGSHAALGSLRLLQAADVPAGAQAPPKPEPLPELKPSVTSERPSISAKALMREGQGPAALHQNKGPLT